MELLKKALYYVALPFRKLWDLLKSLACKLLGLGCPEKPAPAPEPEKPVKKRKPRRKAK